MSDDKEWKWNPPTEYDEEVKDDWPVSYDIVHDFVVTILIVMLVALVINLASQVF
jgi:hypothetical protein